jgi:hypothetical protein
MAEPCKHTGNKVLLVEGKNDCHVIFALCRRMAYLNHLDFLTAKMMREF